MTVRYETAVCPLCKAEFHDPEDFRVHLADEHDLVDDEGTHTDLPESAPAPPVLEAIEPPPATGSAGGPPPSFLPPPPGAPAPPAAATLARRSGPPAALAIVLAVQLLLGLVGIAIVDGDDAPEERSAVVVGGSPASPESPAPAAPAAPDPAADQKRLEAFMPRVSDLPAGWILDSDDPSAGADDSAEFDEQFDSCAAKLNATDAPTTAEDDITFMSDMSGVYAAGGIAPSAQQAVEGIDFVRAAMPCLGQAIVAGARADLPRGVTVTAGAFEPVRVARYGDQSEGRSMNITIAGGGMQIGMRMDVFTIRKDRAMLMVMAFVVNDSLTTTHEQSMLGSIAARM